MKCINKQINTVIEHTKYVVWTVRKLLKTKNSVSKWIQSEFKKSLCVGGKGNVAGIKPDRIKQHCSQT